MTLGYLNRIFCWNTIFFCTISPLTCSRVLRLTAPDTRHKHLPTFTSLSRMQPGLWCVVTSDVVTRGNYQWSPVQPQLPVTELHSRLCSDIGQSCAWWPPGPVSPEAFKCWSPGEQSALHWDDDMTQLDGSKTVLLSQFSRIQCCGGLELSTETGFLDQEAVSK